MDAGILQDADADGCLSITDFPPFGAGGEGLAEPKDSRTDTERWCSYKHNKDPNGNNIYDVKKNLETWGFCLSVDGGGTGTSAPTGEGGSGSTSAPTLDIPNAAFVADGGFQSTPFPCDTAWTYQGEGDNVVDDPINGCLNGDEHPPVGWKSSDLVSPKDARTNTSFWCSVKQGKLSTANSKYDVNPGTDFDAKTQAWGFCLDTSIVAATDSPVPGETLPTSSPVRMPVPSASPVALPDSNLTTPAPSAGSTSSPTEETSSGAPTFQPTTGSTDGTQGNMTSPGPSNAQGLSSGEIAAAVIVPLIVVFGAIGGFAYYKYSSLNDAGAGAGYAEAGTGEPDTAKPGQDTGKPVTEADEGKKNAEEILLG